ncbi:MAG: glycosyl hydrolase family 28 protein [Spirochaetales bacterium]
MNYLDIRDFGAVGDGKTMNTQAIQKALDAANQSGETVLIPAGVFVSGTLNLHSASLHLDANSILRGSGDLKDYPATGYQHNEMGPVTSLLYSLGGKNIRITGYGTIDFNGTVFFDLGKPNVPEWYKTPLNNLQLSECNTVFGDRVNQPAFFDSVVGLVIEGVTFRDSSCWTLSFNHCQNVLLKNLIVDSDKRLTNNDGMHFCACNGVVVQGCTISTGDDCIALTSITDWDTPCENFVISDCLLSSCSKALVLGYQYSHVRNVTISNCVIRESNRGFCIMSGAGVGLVENVTVNNLVIDTKIRAGNWWGNGEPIFLMGIEHDNGIVVQFNVQKPNRKVEFTIDNVIINNVVCHAENAIGIVGNGHSIRNLSLSNIFYTAKPTSLNIALKGRTLDTLPALDFVPVPEDCFLRISGASDVILNNVHGDKSNGVNRIVSTD